MLPGAFGLWPEIVAATTAETLMSSIGIVTATGLPGRTCWSGEPKNE